MISFARGAPAPECLPADELADCARAALERDGVAVLSYGAGAGRPAGVSLHDPDLPEPERAHALGRAPAPDRRARPRARAARARGRPLRPRPLRGRGAADAVRARGRRARLLLLVVLEDDRAGASGRLLRVAGDARRAARGGRRLDVHLTAVPVAGDGLRVPAPRQLRAEQI